VAAIGDAARVTTGGDGSVSVRSTSVNAASANSSADQGGLVAGGGASAAAELDNPETRANLGAGAIVSMGHNLSLDASATNSAGGSPSQNGNGLVTFGDAGGSARIAGSSTVAAIGDAARVSSGGTGSISVRSASDNSAVAGASGGDHGFIAGGGAAATAEMDNPSTEAAVGDLVAIDAPAAGMQVVTDVNTTVSATVKRKVTSFAGTNSAKANASLINARNTADVGTGAQISVDQLSLSAEDQTIRVAAGSEASIEAIAGRSNATANATTTSDTRAHVGGGGTVILAPTGVTLTAKVDSAESSARAISSASQFFNDNPLHLPQGIVESVADDVRNINAEVDGDAGATITTADFEPFASAPDPGDGYDLEATANNGSGVLKSEKTTGDPPIITHSVKIDSTVIIPGGSPQAAVGPPSGVSAGVAPLTPDQLQPVVRDAITRWAETGAVTPEQVARLEAARFLIVDLPGLLLGEEFAGTTVLIDADAAGYGWYVDAIPSDAGQANDPGRAAGRMDLLTVVMHEMGHLLGLPDDDGADPGDLMDEALAPGVRRLPEKAAFLIGMPSPGGPLTPALTARPPAGEAPGPLAALLTGSPTASPGPAPRPVSRGTPGAKAPSIVALGTRPRIMRPDRSRTKDLLDAALGDLYGD
jgi:hypothetical protein